MLLDALDRSALCPAPALATTPPAAGRSDGVVDDACLSGKVAGVLATDELEHDVRADDRDGAGLQDSAEAVADPPVGLRWRFDQQALSLRVEIARMEPLQPDAVSRFVDGQGKLGLHA